MDFNPKDLFNLKKKLNIYLIKEEEGKLDLEINLNNTEMIII